MTTPNPRDGGGDGPEDSVLVDRVLGGDRDAFAVLVRRYERLVFRIVGAFFRQREDVEEVAQEAFLRAFRGLGGFRAGAPLGPWIARIATRVSYDRLRQRQRVREVAWEDLAAGEQGAAQALVAGAGPADRTAARDLLERAMAALAPKDRQVLILADALGFSAKEAAQALACSPLAARIRLHRARRAARKVVRSLLTGREGAGEGP